MSKHLNLSIITDPVRVNANAALCEVADKARPN